MSDVSPHSWISILKETPKGRHLTEKEAQELISHMTMKFRMVVCSYSFLQPAVLRDL